MRKPKLIYLALAALFLWCGNVSAQITAADKMISPGSVVSGGGTSTALDKTITGSFPIIGNGSSASTEYIMTTGPIAVTFTSGPVFIATYAGNAVDTVAVLDRLLKVEHGGGSGTVTGTFYHRPGGASAYDSLDMTDGTNETLAILMRSSLITYRGLEYYFTITDGANTSNIGGPNSPYIFVTSMTNSQGPATPASSYRIVGVPIDITGSSTIATVFEDDLGAYDNTVWRMAAYMTAADTTVEHTLANMPNVNPGRGFWLITKSADTYGANGYSMRPNRTLNNGSQYYEVNLGDTGWIQLANPLPFDVDWDDILVDSGGVIQTGHPVSLLEDSAHWYSGASYSTVQSIPAWGGVFVFTKQHIKLLFPYQENISKSAPKPLPFADENPTPEHWSIKLKMTTAKYIDDGNALGVRADAISGDDLYDFAEQPAAPGAPRLYFSLPDENSPSMRTDFRAPFEDGAIWKVNISPATDRVIEFDGLENIPDGMVAYFLPEKDKRVLLTEGAVVKLADFVTSATIMIGSQKFVSGELLNVLPDKYSMSQNYPNPFNPSTNIDFALPQAGPVILAVFNILGQTVATLVDEEMEAGEYTIQWDGSDDIGRPVASGIYFYRISSGTYSQCLKMALLK